MVAGQPTVSGQGLTGRELAANDAVAKLTRNLLSERLPVPGGEVEEQRL